MMCANDTTCSKTLKAAVVCAAYGLQSEQQAARKLCETIKNVLTEKRLLSIDLNTE